MSSLFTCAFHWRLLFWTLTTTSCSMIHSFSPAIYHHPKPPAGATRRIVLHTTDAWLGSTTRSYNSKTLLHATPSSSSSLRPVPTDLEDIPIPFVDTSITGAETTTTTSGEQLSFIECYADSIAVIDNVEYTIGIPCDYSVAIGYMEEGEQELVPIEVSDSALMNDVFPIAQAIVEEEFGQELILQRTPQTLTLVGELEEDEDEEEFTEDDDLTLDEEDADEEVEVLLTFDFQGKEYSLVRLIDPILLVGKQDPDKPHQRLLLTPQESETIMPVLEDLFLEFHDDEDDE